MNIVRLSPYLGHLRCHGFDLGFGGVPAALGAKLLSADPAVTEYAAGNPSPRSASTRFVVAVTSRC